MQIYVMILIYNVVTLVYLLLYTLSGRYNSSLLALRSKMTRSRVGHHWSVFEIDSYFISGLPSKEPNDLRMHFASFWE